MVSSDGPVNPSSSRIAPARPPAEGKLRILDAAKELMAERGAYAVSLREIDAAAGERNASSVSTISAVGRG